MRIPSKISFPLFCLIALLASTALNFLFVMNTGGLLGTIGLLGCGLSGTVFSALILRWEGSRVARLGLIALPALVTVLSVAAMVYFCRATNQQPVCAQNPLLLNIVPMSIAYILVGGEYFGKFLVWASLKWRAMNGG